MFKISPPENFSQNRSSRSRKAGRKATGLSGRLLGKATRKIRRKLGVAEDVSLSQAMNEMLAKTVLGTIKNLDTETRERIANDLLGNGVHVYQLRTGHNSIDLTDLIEFKGDPTPDAVGEMGFDQANAVSTVADRPTVYDAQTNLGAAGPRAIAYVEDFATEVTRQEAYDNQGITPVELATSAALDIGAGLTWAIRDAANADLFRIVENSAGPDSQFEILSAVDDFDSFATNNTFNNGVTMDVAGVQIDVGVTTNGTITSAGILDLDATTSITLDSQGGNLTLNASGGEILFDDSYRPSSSWAAPMDFAKSIAEWSAVETRYAGVGAELSLVNMLTQAFQQITADDTGTILSQNYSVVGQDGLFTEVSGTQLLVGLPAGYTPTNSTDIVDKAYADMLITGLTWKSAVVVKDYIGRFTVAQINTPLAGIAAGMSVCVASAGTITAGGIPVQTGDIVQYDGTNWALIKEGDATQPLDGTRAIVLDSAGTIPAGGTLTDGTDNSKYVEWDGTSIAPTLTTSLDGWAVIVNGEGAADENTGFVMDVVPVNDEAVGTALSGNTSFSGNTAQFPVDPGTLVISAVTTPGAVWVDDGNGVLVANGSSNSTDGTINYATGAFTVNWSVALGINENLTGDYSSSVDTGQWVAVGPVHRHGHRAHGWTGHRHH
jgi:hypothetical protein